MEEQIKEYSEKIKAAINELSPKMELLKAEAEKHKVKFSKETPDCSISLTESGIIVIKFTDFNKAEIVYNSL